MWPKEELRSFIVAKITLDSTKKLPHKLSKNCLAPIIFLKFQAKTIAGWTDPCYTLQAIIFLRVAAITRKK